MEQVRRVVVVALWGLTLPLREKGVPFGGKVLPGGSNDGLPLFQKSPILPHEHSGRDRDGGAAVECG